MMWYHKFKSKGERNVYLIMIESQKTPKREAVSKKSQWDLTKIFKDDETFENELVNVNKSLKNLGKYQETMIFSAKNLKETLLEIESLTRRVEVLYVYSHLKNDEDTLNTANQNLFGKASRLLAEFSEATAWFEPEILKLSDQQLLSYFEEDASLLIYQHYFEKLGKARPHILSEKEEAILAGASEIFNSASQTFEILDNGDLPFPTVKNDSNEVVQLSHGIYSQLLESSNREVRKGAFQGLYSVYQQFENIFATILSNHIKSTNFQSKVRDFSSARAAALASNNLPEKIYDELITTVHDHLPLLHEYVDLRKDLLNIETLTMYDMHTPILGEAPLAYTYEEAKAITLAALAPMGEDYLSIIEKAFNEDWIDVVENQGKRSGAYSSGSYDTAPYILLNWHNSLDQLYTLVHELGHSVHSYYTRKNQPPVYGDYSIFLAEIASTTNENLLTEYLLATEQEPAVQAYVLNRYLDGFKGTVYRQTQFAEFEHFLYEQDSQGVTLTSDLLKNEYSQLNQKYYGDKVVNSTEITVEWARIPHFYYNYYVYQYATGFAAATTLAKRIVQKEPGALDDYLTYLKAGSSDYPLNVIAKAGVDMTENTYLLESFQVFENRLNDFKTLVKKMAN